MVKRSGLGRNLSALLSTPSDAMMTRAEQELTFLPVTSLQPGKYQPRREFSDDSLMELAQSIKHQGLLQPLVVRSIGPSQYEIIAGERRWRACQLIALTEVAVIVRDVDDETAMALALIENLQREDLNVMEQARAMQRLMDDFSLSHQQIAELVCKSRATVSNFLRLLHLSPYVARLLEHGDIDMGHARCLLTLDASMQQQVAEQICAKQWSVRQTEAWVARLKQPMPEAIPNQLANKKSALSYWQEDLANVATRLNTTIKLKPGKAGKGCLVIEYQDSQSLQGLLTLLKQ